MGRRYYVTADINADYKKLKVWENKGVITLVGIRIENNWGRKSAILPTAIIDHAKVGYAIVGSSGQEKVFETLKKIIGRHNIEDCIHLEAHIRDRYDYFATEDADILDHRETLESKKP